MPKSPRKRSKSDAQMQTLSAQLVQNAPQVQDECTLHPLATTAEEYVRKYGSITFVTLCTLTASDHNFFAHIRYPTNAPQPLHALYAPTIATICEHPPASFTCKYIRPLFAHAKFSYNDATTIAQSLFASCFVPNVPQGIIDIATPALNALAQTYEQSAAQSLAKAALRRLHCYKVVIESDNAITSPNNPTLLWQPNAWRYMPRIAQPDIGSLGATLYFERAFAIAIDNLRNLSPQQRIAIYHAEAVDYELDDGAVVASLMRITERIGFLRCE